MADTLSYCGLLFSFFHCYVVVWILLQSSIFNGHPYAPIFDRLQASFLRSISDHRRVLDADIKTEAELAPSRGECLMKQAISRNPSADTGSDTTQKDPILDPSKKEVVGNDRHQTQESTTRRS
ncbi:hypothetical protein LINGRAHAP2_LOCUS15303 [Linum grandiflorum]